MAEKQTHITPNSAPGRPDNERLMSLIAACHRNERAAQQKLYDIYGSFIFGIIRRYTNDNHIAQEIQSDAFYRIFTKLEQYRFEGAFEGWIRRIAVNAIADYFRRQPPETTPIAEETTDIVTHAEVDGLSKLAYQELLAMIHELPLVQRTVFNLFVFEQYSHKEIAALLNISDNNSRWQINDARRRLKEKIKAVNR